MTNNGRGRPSKFTEERVERILSAARKGMTMQGIARAGGISETTLYAWQNEKSDFSERLNRARSEAEQRLVEDVAENHPKFLLERSYGYYKTQRHDIALDSDADHGSAFDAPAEFVMYYGDKDEDDPLTGDEGEQ